VSVEGRRVVFADGSEAEVDAIVCATGYRLELPFLDAGTQALLGADGRQIDLHARTFHPDLPGLGFIGQFLAQGPYLPLLELQARWIVAVWSGEATLPGEAVMRATIARPRPALDAHHALALTLSEELGVAPEPVDWPELCEALVHGPMLPPRYRLSGPGARPDADSLFTQQLAASPRAPVDPADVAALRRFGWEATAPTT
jgi:dimethylaniline monooxygenase (N-oxide forming)